MTIPASGSLSTSTIQNEIGDTGSITIPDANTRTLTAKSSGALVIPTDFYGKTWGGGGGGGIVVTMTPSSRAWTGAGASSSNTFTATATGNTGPTTFVWSRVVGSGTVGFNGSTANATYTGASVTVNVNAGSVDDGYAYADITVTGTASGQSNTDTGYVSYTNESYTPPGCVMWNQWIPGIGFAEYAKAGDEVYIGDPVTGVTSTAFIEQVVKKREECVRITTKMGVSLDCSISAPIATACGGRIRANLSLNRKVPVKIDDVWEIDEICSVLPIGMQTVMHISANDTFFFAGREIGRYLLHHNAEPKQ